MYIYVNKRYEVRADVCASVWMIRTFLDGKVQIWVEE